MRSWIRGGPEVHECPRKTQRHRKGTQGRGREGRVLQPQAQRAPEAGNTRREPPTNFRGSAALRLDNRTLQTDQRASLHLGQTPWLPLRSRTWPGQVVALGPASDHGSSEQCLASGSCSVRQAVTCGATGSWQSESCLASELCVTGALHGLGQEAPRWVSCSTRRPACWEGMPPAAGSSGCLPISPPRRDVPGAQCPSCLCRMSGNSEGAGIWV